MFGRLVTRSPTVQVVLKPAAKPAPKDHIAAGAEVLEDIFEDVGASKTYWRGGLLSEISPYDPDYALQVTESEIPSKDEYRGPLWYTIEQAYVFDPIKRATWIKAHIGLVGDEQTRRRLELDIAPILVDADRAYAQSVYELSLPPATQQDTSSYGIRRAIGASASRAALAAKLGLPSAADSVGQIISTTTASFSGTARSDMLISVADTLARTSPDLSERVIKELSADDKLKAYSRVIPEVAKYDPQKAAGYIAQLPPSSPTSNWAGKAAVAVIPYLGKDHPDAAVALARTVKDADHIAVALTEAAEFAKPDDAAQMYRDALTQALDISASRTNTFMPGWIAACATLHDPKLGQALYAAAHDALFKNGEPKQPAGFAFYYAGIEPGECRYLIEKQFESAPSPDPLGQRASAVLAMSAIDVDRAISMTLTLKDDYSKFNNERKIGQYVLAPDDVRRTLRFDRWTVGDNWIPGTPTGL